MRDNWGVLCERYTATVMLGKIVGVCVRFGSGKEHLERVLAFEEEQRDSFVVAKSQLEQAVERVELADAWIERIRAE
jgi:hypothetical protein